MTDAPNPAGQNPPAYGSQPPAAPAYSQAPQAYDAPPASRPGRTLGIVAFILSFFVQLIALILGIVALVQSKKAGQKNGFALAAIIISSVLIVVSIIVGILLLTYAGSLATEIVRICGENPDASVNIWGQSVPCSEIQTTSP